jgi:hypothetical protein
MLTTRQIAEAMDMPHSFLVPPTKPKLSIVKPAQKEKKPA